MKKILIWITRLILLLLVLWGAIDYISFHEPVVPDKTEQIHLNMTRPPIGGVVIRPRIIRYIWGLKNIPERLASHHNNRFIDFAHIRQIGGKGFLGLFKCQFDVSQGSINNFQITTRTNNVNINNYLENVITSFSGDFSAWADVSNIKVRIDFSEKRITLLNKPLFQLNEQAQVVQAIQSSICPLGTGTVEYEDELGHSQYLFAFKK